MTSSCNAAKPMIATLPSDGKIWYPGRVGSAALPEAWGWCTGGWRLRWSGCRQQGLSGCWTPSSRPCLRTKIWNLMSSARYVLMVQTVMLDSVIQAMSENKDLEPKELRKLRWGSVHSNAACTKVPPWKYEGHETEKLSSRPGPMTRTCS